MEEMYRRLQGMFASELRDEWRVRLEEYPEIVQKAVAEMGQGATRGRRMIRVAGQSGSGKTTRLLPEAERRFSGAKPIVVAAERMLKYYPYREEVAAEYGAENLRRKTDDFTSMMMFLVLPELLRGGYDVILEVAFLGRELEAILVRWLKETGYTDVEMMVAAVPVEVSQSRLEKRGWRHEEKVEKMFMAAVEESLEFYREVWAEVKVEFV